MEKEIIGYKCPTDLFEGRVKKGTRYFNHKHLTSLSNMGVYSPVFDSVIQSGMGLNLPKEIVETWEPIYKEEYKDGDWVYYNCYNVPYITKIKDPNMKLCYINVNKLSYKYIENQYLDIFPGNNHRLATKEEIESALIEIAKQKGYKEDTKIKSLFGVKDYWNVGYSNSNYYSINPNNIPLKKDVLYFNGTLIYADGKWAEIIKEEPIRFGDASIEFVKKPNIEDSYFAVNTIGYYYNGLISLRSFMQKGQIKSLNVGCQGQYKVDLNMLERIIKKLEE